MRWLRDGLGVARSLLFTIPLFYLNTLLLGLVSYLIAPFDRDDRRLYGLARLWARLILATCLVRVNVRGLENLEPGRHYVFVANHQSYIDIPILLVHLPARCRFMAKATLFYFPFVGRYLRRTGNLPIRGQSIYANARRLLQAVDYMRAGHSLVVFPEGGRSLSGGIEEFKPGIFLGAIKVGAPVVPVTLVGTRQLLPPSSWYIRPGRAEMVIAPPIATAGLGKSQLAELVARVRSRIEENFLGAAR